MKKILLIILLTLTSSTTALAAPFEYEVCNLGWKHVHHKYKEEIYQNIWCTKHDGIKEYENKDLTRVDCLTKTHAIEFDFANKWAESVGQALHYAIMTNKKPKVVLILDNPKSQMIYYKRLKRIGKKYNIDTEYITNKILKSNDLKLSTP